MPGPDATLASEVLLRAPVVIFQTDEQGRCVDVNARWSAVTGLSREEALGHGWLRAVHPDDRERVSAEWYGGVREGRDFVLEYRYQNGPRTTWVLGHAVAVRDTEQRVVRYVGTATDITKAKVEEESAFRSAQTLRTLFDQLPDLVIVHRFGPILFANAAAEKALGYALDELRGLAVEDLLHPDERETVRHRIELLREQRSALNPPRMTRMVRKDGGVSIFEVIAVRSEYELEPAVITMLHDVTARTARESRLRASLHGFSDAFFMLECERDIVGEIEDFRIVELNRSLERIFEKPHDALANERLSKVLDPELFDALFPTYVRAQELAEPVSEELNLERLGMWVQHQVLPLPNGIVATFHDTTEKRRSEERLRASEERWQFALEGSNQGVWDWNVETGDVFFSKRWKSMLGFDQHEIPNRIEEWSKRVHPDDMPDVLRHIEQHFRGETPFYETEHRVLCKDGSYLWILDRGCVTSWTAEQKPHRMVGTHTDISKSKDVERLLRSSLEDKEILLKEVHHRVKNNLQVTSSLLNLQASKVSDLAAQEALREAQGRIHSIALLHERLYQADEFAHIHLSEYTGMLANELRRSLGSPTVSLEIDAADISVELDLAMPYALLLNELVTNAFKHAFPEHAGTILVRLRQLGDSAELVVRDDGVGLPRGFAPERSGSLGMTLVRLLTQQMRGSFSMRSENGTTATVRFPCVCGARAADAQAPDASPLLQR